MKDITLIMSLVFATSVLHGQKVSTEDQVITRIEKIINSEWTFGYFPEEDADKGYESPGFNDSRWPAISLPHTWNSFETTGEINPYSVDNEGKEDQYWRKGWGWYRKHFTVNMDYSEKRIFIEFEGVNSYCKVWLNGKYLGDHSGGYGSFDFDITGFLNQGKDNVLAVAIGKQQKNDLDMTITSPGSYKLSPGINRNVTLVLKNKLFIPMQGSAIHEGGTFITTPMVSEKEAIVRVQTWVRNDNLQSKKCNLKTSVIDSNNKIIQVIKSDAEIDPGEVFRFDITTKPIKNPRLWSSDDPYLYTILSEVFESKLLTDSISSPLGLRWFRWDLKDSTFYLNGKKMTITGGNYYPQYPVINEAVPKWIIRRDLNDISENLKYNFIRTVIHPADKVVYELADRYGIVVEEESTCFNDQNLSSEIREQQLKEMIRRDRNHPGIMFWGTGNISSNQDLSKFFVTEDSTRILNSGILPRDLSSTYYKYSEKKIETDSISGSKREAAGIILSGSHHRISADRGSVVVLTAYIVDINGNKIFSAARNLTWRISGPATLIGPEAYLSDIYKADGIVASYYSNMPVINMIRSTGKPGKIHVTVFSSGLASGSVDIEAEEIQPDNSFVSEQVLDDLGRKSVSRTSLTFSRLNEVPREIKMTSDELDFGTSDKNGYVKEIKKYILKNNPPVDSVLIEFSTLVDLLATYLTNNNGRLMADDYNFNADNYNNCRLISGYVSSTKLPVLYKNFLKQYYADLLIRYGFNKDAGDEMNWLNWIPSGGVVVIVRTDITIKNYKDARVTEFTDLSDIISDVYPQFAKFSIEGKRRALQFISKMNPNVHTSSSGRINSSESKNAISDLTYTAEKGKPILIPDFKFISE